MASGSLSSGLQLSPLPVKLCAHVRLVVFVSKAFYTRKSHDLILYFN